MHTHLNVNICIHLHKLHSAHAVYLISDSDGLSCLISAGPAMSTCHNKASIKLADINACRHVCGSIIRLEIAHTHCSLSELCGDFVITCINTSTIDNWVNNSTCRCSPHAMLVMHQAASIHIRSLVGWCMSSTKRGTTPISTITSMGGNLSVYIKKKDS